MKVPILHKTTGKRKATRDVGASQMVTGINENLRSWIDNHRFVAGDSLHRLFANLAASTMTWLVIGFAIALPTGLYMVLENAGTVSDGWQSQPRITLYLREEVSFAGGLEISDRLLTHPEVSATQYISASAALEEFKVQSGFGEIVESLEENPLPAIVLVSPQSQSIDDVTALVTEFENLTSVASAVVDIQWLQRLYALLELAERGIVAISIVLAMSVALIVGNTIRLAIESRRAEIEVVKLVGGTDAFVRRPFLYTGAWYGFGGGMLAWLMVEASLWWISGPVAELAGLYESDFELQNLGVLTGLSLLLAAIGLGLAGAWLAVNRHLKAIQPH